MKLTDFCIISNNCIAGFWYRDILECDYENPFIWCTIKLSDFIGIIENFDSINFNNAKCVISEGEMIKKSGSKWTKILLDNRYNVFFTHYKQSSISILKPIVNRLDVICPNVISYTEDVWKRRSERIPYQKERIYVFWDDVYNSNLKLDEFVLTAKKHTGEKFVLFTPDNSIKPESENMIILPITDYDDVPKHTNELMNTIVDKWL